MILDIFNQIFTEIATALRIEFTESSIAGQPILVNSSPAPIPQRFPCCSIVLVDSPVYQKTIDGSSRVSDNHTRLYLEIQAFSDIAGSNTTQANEIILACDKILRKYKFTRTFNQPVQNEDSNIARRIARYNAVISKDGLTFRS